MRECGFLVAVAVAVLAVGCTATPPKSQQVSNDPLLAREVLLLIDVCVQRDGLGSGDYFVVAESEAGSRAALETLHQYLKDSDIHVRSAVTAVCAARLNVDGSPIRVADSVGKERRQAEQPLRISGTNTEDPQYVQALGVISTYAFERAAVQRKKDDEKKKQPDEKNAKESEPPAAISTNDFRAAADMVKDRTRASSVLYLGALGVSRSATKAAAQMVGNLAIGMGTAVATAGLGTGYYFWFMPGFKADGVLMEGALIDLQSGQLTWSNAVRTGGDPVDVETIANSRAFDLLFHEILFQPLADQPVAPSNKQ